MLVHYKPKNIIWLFILGIFVIKLFNGFDTFTSSDFKCLSLSDPDEGKLRKALRTHINIKRVVFIFLTFC